MRQLGLCRILIDAGFDRALAGQPPPVQFDKTAAARRLMLKSKEAIDAVPVICDGWTAVAEYLRNGRRQILSFALPGDFVSISLLFQDASPREVETVTPVRYRNFDRAALREAMFAHREVLERLAADCIEEKERTAELAIDLGRRGADQRVARLLLDLMERLSKCGMVRDQAFDFPLRQFHIADAMGLTPPYVNQVLTGFRRDRLVAIENRMLTILDAAKLRRLAEQ